VDREEGKPVSFTDAAGARAYISQYDARARRLARTSLPDLRVTYARVLGSAGQILLVGGPVTREELATAILELEFPEISEARSTYLRFTQP
jgi:YD repeat-containing protein